MRRKATCGFLAVLCTVISVWSAMMVVPAHPAALSVVQHKIDLGTLRQQADAKTSFLLLNESRFGIEIAKVLTTCSCTSGIVDKLKLPSKASTPLFVTVNTTTRRGPSSFPIVVQYKIDGEPTLKMLQLEVIADVQPHYDIRPQDKLVFYSNQGAEREIILAPNDNSLEVSEAYCSHAAFKIRVGQPIGQSTERRIHVRFDPTKWNLDSARPNLVIVTNSKLEPMHRIPINVVSK